MFSFFIQLGSSVLLIEGFFLQKFEENITKIVFSFAQYTQLHVRKHAKFKHINMQWNVNQH